MYIHFQSAEIVATMREFKLEELLDSLTIRYKYEAIGKILRHLRFVIIIGYKGYSMSNKSTFLDFK